jgi:hypothetical protein
MPKSSYLQGPDAEFSTQLLTFKNNLGPYAATLGVSAAQATAQAADADYFAYELACQQIAQNLAQQWTAWKDLSRDGGTPPPAGMPQPPVFPAAVAAVAPGIEARFRALVQQIKKHANYNEAIGQTLGIEGSEQTGPDLTTLRPVIDAAVAGNRVEIDWGWQGNRAFLDACEIQVDRADGKGWVLLTIDTTPSYTDTQAFPSVPTKWSYRAIYRLADAQVGQWSQIAEVMVG